MLHSAPTDTDAMIRRRPQSYEFHVSGSQPISALRVRSYDNPDMREGAPYTSYENMNGCALLEESSAAKLRYKGGINIIFSYLGDLRWLSWNSGTISYIYFFMNSCNLDNCLSRNDLTCMHTSLLRILSSFETQMYFT